MNSLTFSQASILAFLTCRRRFQLRYLENLSWPDLPFTPEQRAAIARGQRFHQIIERYFLGLHETDIELGDAELQSWWRRFAEHVLPLPAGRTLPELRLTVPIGDHFLTGRFDLVLIGEQADRPSLTIYDWKTSKPATTAELADAWQSRLYLAMLAESNGALVTAARDIHPDQITLVYWYAADPRQPRIIHYSAAQHRQNWSQIVAVVRDISACLVADDWPLTDNWSHCQTCAYATYCGRWQSSTPVTMIAEETVEYLFDSALPMEPESP